LSLYFPKPFESYSLLYILKQVNKFHYCSSVTHSFDHVKWVPVTMEWCILKLQLEERSPIWKVAKNILNKQLWTAIRGGPPVWGLYKGLTTHHHENISLLQNIHRKSLRLGPIFWYDLSNKRRTRGTWNLRNLVQGSFTYGSSQGIS
jgi:hypothetical protein